MKVHSQNKYRSSSLTHSPTSSFITPRKFPNHSLKGLNMTITKIKDNTILNTRDKTITPKSSKKNLHFVTPINKHPAKQLFTNATQYSPYQPPSPLRNKSLPTFSFHKPLSGFSALSKPYNRLDQYSTSFKSSSSKIQSKFSPLTPTQNSFHKNITPFKKQVSPFEANQLNFQTQSKNKLSPTLDNVFDPISLHSTSRLKQWKTSEIYLAQTPKKQNSMRQGFPLKNLRKRLTKNSADEGPQTISSKGRFSSDKKRDFDFSLNISPKLSRNEKLLGSSQESIKILDSDELKDKTTTRSKRQRQEFFNFTPKESQELDLQVFELTQSNTKQMNDKNEGQSPFWRAMIEPKTDDISLIKPVKRKLQMNAEDSFQTDQLNESLILSELLRSLNKNKELAKRQKGLFTMELIRKCSSSLCLVKNNQTNSLFGLIRLESKEKFIEPDENKGDEQLCIRKYMEWKDYAMIESFEYTLEQIFEMKLVEEKSIPELIKKFHRTLNGIKEKNKGRIDLKKLKERIVYTHGQFKLIPIVEKPQAHLYR